MALPTTPAMPGLRWAIVACAIAVLVTAGASSCGRSATGGGTTTTSRGCKDPAGDGTSAGLAWTALFDIIEVSVRNDGSTQHVRVRTAGDPRKLDLSQAQGARFYIGDMSGESYTASITVVTTGADDWSVEDKPSAKVSVTESGFTVEVPNFNPPIEEPWARAEMVFSFSTDWTSIEDDCPDE